MKFSTTALTFLAASTTSLAFAPQPVSRHAAFVPTARPYTALFSSSDKVKIEDLIANDNEKAPYLNGVLKDIIASDSTDNTKVLQSEEELSRLSAIEVRAAAAAYMNQYQGQSGASLIYTKLQEYGVKVVNGFSGGAVLPLLDQFHESHPRHFLEENKNKKPIRWITNSNEASAGHIAEGYAKAMPFNKDDSSKDLPVGVAIATSGPGVTNLITPLQDAICDGVPIVVLCGQAATVAPPDAFQSSPAVDLTRPCTKWSYQIKSAAEIPLVLDYAFYIARNGRPGPVFVDLPKDLQNQVLTSELINNFIDAENPGKEGSFARLKKSYKSSGKVFQALQLGTDGKDLPFEIFKNNEPDNKRYMIRPITDLANLNEHHKDHNPTNRIIQTPRPNHKDDVESSDTLSADSKLVDKLAKLMLKAKKPVIIAGQGCNDAPDELMEFATKMQIPVATTLHGLGCFDERHELALNMVGMHGHPTPNFLVQEADLVICIGSRFDDRITGRMSDFVPEAKLAALEGRGGIIHVDIRISEKGKQVQPTFFVHSTGKKFLQTINKKLDTMDKSSEDSKPNGTEDWIDRMKDLQANYPVKIPFFETLNVDVKQPDGSMKSLPRTRMSAQSVVAELDKQLLESNKMDDAIFTTGVGVHQMVAAQLITWTQPRQMLSSGSLGTMGVALGYSIGAKLACDGKIVIAVDGDGSFNMTFTELKTLAEQKIPVKIIIVDNDGQMMVEYWQRLFHNNRLLAVRNSHNPDYSTLAKAFGIKSVYCDAQEDLQEKMREFLFDDPEEPVLFHVRVERTPCLPLVAPGQPLQDMILEDVDVDVDGAAAPS